jgi:hypothetical protein
LTYGKEAPPAPQWLVVYTWVIVGFAVVCIIGLVYSFFTKGKGPEALGACSSPFIVLGAMLQWRGVFRNCLGHAKGAAVLQWICGGMLIFAVVTSMGEAVLEGHPTTAKAWLIATGVLVLGAAILMLGVSVFRWARRMERERQ